MRKISLVFIFSLVSLLSCKKISNNKIDACIYVKQYKTETPIPNAEVQILRGKPGLGYGSEVIETVYTNANGKATYKAKGDKDYFYFADAHKENYSDIDEQVILTTGERNFNTTIFKYANSYVKLHVKNVHPVNNLDLIQLSSFCLSNFYLSGPNIDTTLLYCDNGYNFLGSFDYSYSYTVTKNNISVNFPFSFRPIPFDTITVDLNY